MKKILLPIFALALIATAAQAQRGFNLSADTLRASIPADKEEHKQKGFANTELEDLILEWEILSVDMPEGWSYTMCDNFQCYSDLEPGNVKEASAISSSTPGPFEGGVSPNEITGTGTMTLLAYEKGDKTKADTMVFIFDAAVSAKGIDPVVDFNVYPNPAKTTLNITFTKKITDDLEVKIFNLVGQEQRNISVVQLNNTASVDIRELTVGTYLIQFITPEGKMTTQRFTKRI